MFTDMIGHEISLDQPPRRIVSLVPSQTELLYDLGLDEEVVGITRFCVHPDAWFRSKKRIGGTKTIHIDKVRSLRPGLVIANKEENTKEQVEELSALFPTWTSDIHTVDDALQMITQVGSLTGRPQQAAALTAEIDKGFSGLKKAATPRRVAYFIWRKPWMCAGGDTFISDMLQRVGWQNVLAGIPRYPEVHLADLAALDTDLVLLSSEPYPFRDAHIAEIRTGLPWADIKLVDGEMMSWYGSRMKYATAYLADLAANL